MNRKIEHAEIITALAECYEKVLSERALDMYLTCLADIPTELLKRAAGKAMRSSKWMPRIAELRELAGCHAEQAMTLEQHAAAAWGEVQEATKLGSYRSVDFADPIINACIRTLGGWPEVLAMPTQQFDIWLRKDFIKTYVGLASAGVNGEICEPLQGLGTSGTVFGIDGKEHERPHVTARIATKRETPAILRKQHVTIASKPAVSGLLEAPANHDHRNRS